MKKKIEAALKAIGLYLAINACLFGAVRISWWVRTSAIGHWLEIDKPTKPYMPGRIYLIQFFLVWIAFAYYRDKVKHD